MKVVVFGGAGYLGGALIPVLLAAGHRVTVFDNLSFGPAAVSPWLTHDNFNLKTGDIRDIKAVVEALVGQEAAVILAALVGEAACDQDPAETVAVNYLATLNIMKAAAYFDLDRCLFTSTDSCYGAQENVYLTEESPLKPISLYTELKARVEEEFLKMPGPARFRNVVLSQDTH